MNHITPARLALSRIEYPAWHDDARKMRADGKDKAYVCDHFGITTSMASQILAPAWKSYAVLRRIGFSANKALGGVSGVSKNIEKYEFVPTPGPTPKEMERKPRVYKQVPSKEDQFMATAAREFQSVKKFEHGKTLTGARIVCASCGKSDEYYNYSGTVNPLHLPKEFTRMSWIVGGSHRADRCPECSKSLRKATTHEAPSTVVQMKPNGHAVPDLAPVLKPVPVPEVVPVVVAPEPAPVKLSTAIPAPAPIPQKTTFALEFGKTERRIIFAKLNEVYEDEKVGYMDDWSDAKVAEDLGVPADWVAQVRDHDFGPEITKQSKEQASKALAEMISRMDRNILLIDGKLEQSRSIDAKIEVATKEAVAAADRLDELLAALETHDKQIEALMKTYDADVADFKKIVAAMKG